MANNHGVWRNNLYICGIKNKAAAGGDDAGIRTSAKSGEKKGGNQKEQKRGIMAKAAARNMKASGERKSAKI